MIRIPQKERMQDLLELIGQVRQDDNTPELTAFLGLRGETEHGSYTVVGQAVNGWIDGWKPSEFRNPGGRDAVLQQLEQKDDIGLVRNKTSMFWKVARGVGERLGAFDTEDAQWPLGMNWTNLFRIAPARGARPSQGLRLLQQPLCAQLLSTELFLWRPSHLLMLTGLSWAAPFVTAFRDTRLTLTDDEVVRATARISIRGRAEVPVVIADHPSRKRGGEALFVDRIDHWFSRLQE